LGDNLSGNLKNLSPKAKALSAGKQSIGLIKKIAVDTSYRWGNCPGLASTTKNISRIGREKHLEKQEKWKQFLPTPSKRVYSLLSLMRARSEERDA
jgi:hypothetical protein